MQNKVETMYNKKSICSYKNLVLLLGPKDQLYYNSYARNETLLFSPCHETEIIQKRQLNFGIVGSHKQKEVVNKSEFIELHYFLQLV